MSEETSLPEGSPSLDTVLKVLQLLMKQLGDVSIGKAVTWVEVQKNAEELAALGHADKV